MPCELTVSIKDEEKTLKKKFLIYENFTVNENDPMIKSCIEETLKNFSAPPLRITVRINLLLE